MYYILFVNGIRVYSGTLNQCQKKADEHLKEGIRSYQRKWGVQIIYPSTWICLVDSYNALSEWCDENNLINEVNIRAIGEQEYNDTIESIQK